MNTDANWTAPIILATLKNMARRYEVSEVAKIILDDPRFRLWPASSVEGSHHYYDGGLAEHTYEVADLCEKNSSILHCNNHLDLPELFLAALFHDVGKMWDYQKVDGKWVATEHKRLIHHISRSGVEWMKAAESCGFDQGVQDRVLHAILSHHGQRAWGSPVAPKSRMAWLLHLCDQLSARMNDCDTNDVIVKGDK